MFRSPIVIVKILNYYNSGSSVVKLFVNPHCLQFLLSCTHLLSLFLTQTRIVRSQQRLTHKLIIIYSYNNQLRVPTISQSSILSVSVADSYFAGALGIVRETHCTVGATIPECMAVKGPWLLMHPRVNVATSLGQSLLYSTDSFDLNEAHIISIYFVDQYINEYHLNYSIINLLLN